MSNYSLKLSLIFSFLFTVAFQPIYSQGNNGALLSADKLFLTQRYSESLAIYQNILENNQHYSPQMLLKMAYIQEMQQNFTAAIYYLHLYYKKRPNPAILKKIEDIAQHQQYLGYEYSDSEFFRTQVQIYNQLILQVLLMIAVATLTIVFFVYKRKRILPGLTFQGIYLGYLTFILFYLNFFSFTRKGIISQNNVAIMAAPAAGSPWLATTSEGHRIPLINERDIWYETEWNGKRAYIRKKNVLELP